MRSPARAPDPGILAVVEHQPAGDKHENIETATASSGTPPAAGLRKRGFSAEVLESRAAVDRLLPEWRRLFDRSGCGNPFAHPEWVLAWLDRFAADDQLEFVVVRREDELVGIAPFFLKRHRFGPLRARSIRLLGTGRDASITEQAQILIEPGLQRVVLSTIVAAFEERIKGWDWVEFALTNDQGWFEPEWLGASTDSVTYFVNTAPDAWVVVPLPERGQKLNTILKRNVKESVRRGVNRFKREGHEWTVRCLAGEDEITTGLTELARLHTSRASLGGSLHHDDALANEPHREFVFDAVRRLAPERHAEVWVLEVDGTPVAAQLVLRAGHELFFSISGHDPAWWNFNPATVLTARILEDAIERGCTLANLSRGPRVAKLRWSEHLQVQRNFALVNASRSSSVKLATHWVARSVGRVYRERRYAQDRASLERAASAIER